MTHKKPSFKRTASFHHHLVESLRNPAEASAYLEVALEEYQQDGNTEFFLSALRNVAEAHGGISQLAKKTKLNRQSLYQTLSGKGNPTLNTLASILKCLGFHLTVQPIPKK